jgi:arylsulfatase A-like enzyme
MPTVLAAAGIPLESAHSIDGVNLLPYLTGEASGPPHEALYWRLGVTMQDPALLSDLSGAVLYNLKDDTAETRSLAAARPDKVEELTADWQRWNRSLQKP